jgi:DNA-binding beta-propeller fold protein YncE
MFLALGSFGQGIITRVAGTNFLFPSQPLPALTAPIGQLAGVALDASGNLYLADQSNSMVMKVNPQGILSVYAGNGSIGFSGDNGPATSAALNAPAGIAVDARLPLRALAHGGILRLMPFAINVK